MSMVEFGYFLAPILIVMVVAVHGYRLLSIRRDLRTDTGSANAPAARYI